MALNSRQQRLYQHRVDLYAPIHPPVQLHKDVPDIAYRLAAADVPCYMFTQPETDVTSVAGRVQQDNLFTLDKIHFESDTPIEDTWMIQLQTAGHPDKGKWWIAEGNPQPKVSFGKRRPNYALVYAKRSNRPKVVEA
jgi:hypothetical protein